MRGGRGRLLAVLSTGETSRRETPPAGHIARRQSELENSQDESIPVHDIKVTLIDGEGKRIDSTRTNYNGRFLIERNGVAVGYNWEPRHIYVEIADDRNTEEPDGKPTYRYRRILKEIGVAPNDKAFLTMDDIVVERIEAE